VNFTRTETGSTFGPSGPASVTLTNNGTIAVAANAHAVGEPGAFAYANATAVAQLAAGSSASANVENNGYITAVASAVASGQNAGSATAHAAGVLQGAVAAGVSSRTVFHGTATLHYATAGTTQVSYLTTAATRTFTDAPVGPATVTLTNTGAINVAANAVALNAQGGPAIGAVTTTPAFASAYAIGVGQEARGTEATLTVTNDGSIAVAASAYASGATAATALAGAQGIVQGGNASMIHGTTHAALQYVTGSNGHPFQTLNKADTVDAANHRIFLFGGTYLTGITLNSGEWLTGQAATVDDQGVRAASVRIGEGRVELLEPLAQDTPVGRFLAKRGPGMHHVAYQVPDIEATLESLRAAGIRLIDETPRTGIRGSRVAFLHPKSSGGVLTEIVQPAKGH